MRIHRAVPGAGALLIGSLLLAGCGGSEPADEAETPAAEPIATPEQTTPAATSGATAAGLPAGVTTQMVQQGQQLFTGQGICYTCHGQNAQGTTLAPNLTDDQWLWVTPGDGMYEEIVTLIKTGVTQPKEHPAPMPAMGQQLSDEQVRSVAAYVVSLSGG